MDFVRQRLVLFINGLILRNYVNFFIHSFFFPLNSKWVGLSLHQSFLAKIYNLFLVTV